MTGALVILAALVVIGLLLYVTDVAYFRPHHHDPAAADAQKKEGDGSDAPDSGATAATAAQNPTDEDICCGQHLVCEKTSLALTSPEIIYYDDEELDRFVGRDPLGYTPEEVEEFRDVLLTLLPEDVAGWAKSIALRKIELPGEVRDELLLIVTELRSA